MDSQDDKVDADYKKPITDENADSPREYAMDCITHQVS